MIGAIENKKQEYNAEPVFYCEHCLSLKVMVLDQAINYCEDCGSTETQEAHIDEWDELYKNRYGKSYLNK